MSAIAEPEKVKFPQSNRSPISVPYNVLAAKQSVQDPASR